MLAQSSPAGLAFFSNLRIDEDGNPSSTWKIPTHIELLNQEIQKLAAREYLEEGILGLLVEMPPRHGKSDICSHYTPPWYIGSFPAHRVALVSYEAEFAQTWGRRARNIVEEYGPSLFNVQVDKRSSAADRWDVHYVHGRRRRQTGGMVTTGVGGPLTGMGANLLIYDDPYKSLEQAQSEAYREKVWDHWTGVGRPRLEPGGVVIIIHTRWHEDDLIGRLLDQEPENWKRFRFPAVAEEADVLGREVGEPLWPERYPLEELEKIKASVGSYVWNALYQQRPTKKGGSMFKWDSFNIVKEMPCPVKKVVRYWDLAATEDSGDYTVGVKMALGVDGNKYVLDVVRGQWNPEGNERKIAATAMRDGKLVRVRMEEEKGASGKSLTDHYRRHVIPTGYNFGKGESKGDKVLRATPYSAAQERGEIYLIEANWNIEFMEEHVVFDKGRFDDQVDAASGAFNELSRKTGVATY